MLLTLVVFLAVLVVLVLAHEMGHFVTARIFKVRIEEFGIGFPPRLATMFESKGTKFTINMIPLGGFVRPKGENDPEIEGGLAAASPWVRLGVLFAGPMMNIAVGIILAVVLLYNLGEPVPDRVLVLQVVPGSPAEQAGLEAGDYILQINDIPIKTTDDLYEAIYANLGSETTLVYERGEELVETIVVPRENPPPEEGAIGIAMGYATQPTTITKAIPRGFVVAVDYTKNVLSLPMRIAQGEVSPEQGRPLGYKGMFDVYQEIQNPLWFFMVISLSLGIFNLFPIPALDGGRILLVMPEILIRRRVPQKFENTLHLVGFTLLIILLIYINIQDFVNPIQIP